MRRDEAERAVTKTLALVIIVGAGSIMAAPWSWQQPHATVLEHGGLAWAPEPFAFRSGISRRYIDYENGSDFNTGYTTNAPWKHHPWDANAQGNAAAGSGSQTYIFRRGVIYRGQLTPKDSGTSSNPIRLTSDPSWGEGEACLYGSEAVTNWQQGPAGVHANIPSPGSVWYADLPFAPRMVCMVDTTGGITRIPLARTPNWTITDPTDPLRNCWRWNSTTTTNIGANSYLLARSTSLNNADPDYYLGGLVWSEWNNLMSAPYAATIDVRDAGRQSIGFTAAWGGSSPNVIANHRFWLEDKPHYLDQDGEYWFDKQGTGGRLYLRLPGGIAPSTVTVEAARHVGIIYKFLGSEWHNTEINGLTFRFSNIYWPLHYRDFTDYPLVQSAAIHFEGTGTGLTVRNCVFEYCGTAIRFRAPYLSTSMDNIAVLDNDIRYADHGAIAVQNGPGRPGLLGRVQVLRNRIRDVGLRAFRVNGHHTLHVQFADTVEIAGNILERMGGSGIFVFGGKSDSANYDAPFTRWLIHHNQVEECMLCANDWGGVETWQGGPFYVYNNVVYNPLGRMNFASARTGSAYYLDGAFKNFYFNNIAWGTQSWVQTTYADAPWGFQQVHGHFNTFFNNSAHGFRPTFHQQSANTGRVRFFGNLVDASKSYVFDNKNGTSDGKHYETLAYDWNLATRMQNNFGVFEYSGTVRATPAAFATALNTRQAMAWATGSGVANSVVQDAGGRDFRPLAGSAAQDSAGRVFVPWALSRVEGEWHFSLDRKYPTNILDEAWYMRPAYVGRDTYQNMPSMPLAAVNVTSGSFVASPFDDWAPGALRLDGATQYAWSSGSGPNGMTLDIGTNNFVLEVIFRTTAGHTGGVLVSKSADAGYTLRIDEEGYAVWSIRSSGADVYRVTSGMQVNDGAWHHLLVEYRRGTPNLCNLYLNGVYANGTGAGSPPGAGVMLASAASFYVGRDTGGNYFSGDVDFVRVSRASLAEAYTTCQELYDWQFGGPQFFDFRSAVPQGPRDIGALECSYAGEYVPAIALQPTNVVVEAGAAGGVRIPPGNGLFFAWQRDGVLLAGETNPAVRFAPASGIHDGVYTLIISNMAGAVTSAPISVTVIPEPGLLLALAAALLARRR